MDSHQAFSAGFQFPLINQNEITPTAYIALDQSIQRLNDNKRTWATLPVEEVIDLFTMVMQQLSDVSEYWAMRDIQNRGLTPDHWDAAMSYFGGPIMVLQTLRSYLHSLKDIQRYGKPRLHGGVTTKMNGQVAVPVFPKSIDQCILFRGFKGEVWLDFVNKSNQSFSVEQANAYQQQLHEGKISLVLGAGNVSGITINDTLHKLINERHVVLIKVHPVTEYLGEILKKIFSPLIQRGFLQVVYGGVPEGAYLCQHELIDTIHITGSDKTYEHIVFGTGESGEENKRRQQPLLNKPITSELGNVTPAIIIPGPWKDSDFAYQGENLASSMTINNGFNCVSTRVMIQQAGWEGRERLLNALRTTLANTPLTKSYYPGAQARIREMVANRADAEQFGNADSSQTPWTLIPYLDSHNTNEYCFTSEVFGGFTSETALEATSIPEFIEKAVAFCNTRLWGNLAAMIIVHPDSLKDPSIKAALDKAVSELRYGCISINHFPAIAIAFATTTWGGFPGNEPHDIQSGSGQVGNTLMIEHAQKSVITGLFKVKPKPAWFSSNRKSLRLARALLAFERRPSFFHFMKILIASFI